jgi:hypothetical protein
VRISAIERSLRTMPPISCTSKWRMPSARLEASRTTANAGTRRSSSFLPAFSSALNSSVLAFSSASLSLAICGSRALMASTFG